MSKFHAAIKSEAREELVKIIDSLADNVKQLFLFAGQHNPACPCAFCTYPVADGQRLNGVAMEKDLFIAAGVIEMGIERLVSHVE